MRGSLIAKRGCFLLLLIVIAFYFYGLGHLPLVGPDEPRYAQVAREMFLRGDLITPTLGGHTWFEKPVLLYWLIELSFRLFGISEAAARVGPALCGVLTVAAVYWVTRRVEKSTEDLQHFGCASSLLLATMFGIIVFSRGVSFDIVVTMPITWALCFFLASTLTEDFRKRRRLLIGFYVFTGISLLAKGLIGFVIPVGVLFLFQLFRRSFPDRVTSRSVIWGLPLTLAVAATWYAPVIAKHGWHFIDEFFIQHHFARFVSNKYHHPQPFYFYIPILLALALPWLPLIIRSLVELRGLNWRSANPLDRIRVFGLAWLLLPIVFFSFSRSKLPGYILPVLPALAILSGYELTKILASDSKRTWTIRLTGALFVFFAIGIVIYAQTTGESLIVAVPAALSGLFALLTRKVRLATTTLILAVPLSFCLALNSVATSRASALSTRDLLNRAGERGYGSASVYQLHDVDRSTEFYAAGRLAYDATGEPLKFEGAWQALDAAKQKNGAVLVIVPVKYLQQLTTLNDAEIEVIGDNTEFALVAVRSKV